MKKKYPRISQFDACKDGLCIFCKRSKANIEVVIQTNWFRGDDEVVKVHRQCIYNKNKDEVLTNIIKEWSE